MCLRKISHLTILEDRGIQASNGSENQLPQFITGRTGKKLYYHTWSVEKPRARVIIVHGFAEHCLRYDRFAQKLNEIGLEVVGYDQQGHGRSEGSRAYTPSFNLSVENLELLVNHLSDTLPTFLFGHSMGGLLAVMYCIDKNSKHLSGLITSGALLKLDEEIPALLLHIVPILSYLFPKLPTQPIEKKYVTSSESELKKYMEDPLIYRGGVKARVAYEMIRNVNYVRSKFGQVELPILVLHGDSDKLVNPAGSIQLYEKSSSVDKSLQLYEGFYHEILNEPNSELAINDIREWVNTRLDRN